MSRFVKARPRSTPLQPQQASITQNPVKEYAERVAKYIPAEILAAYTSVVALFANSTESVKFWGLLIFTFLLWIITPFYFNWLKEPEDQPSFKTQVSISMVAFVIWTYATNGDAGIFGKQGLNIYFPEIAGSVLILFSIVSGLIIPRKS